MTRRDKIRNEHIRGTTGSGARVQENYRKTTEVVRPCEDNERGAHIEKNVRCGDTGEKKKRTSKPTMERCMQERHDISASERGQHDKQGRMEEETNQLYRRPQMTGQAREKEEEYVVVLSYHLGYLASSSRYSIHTVLLVTSVLYSCHHRSAGWFPIFEFGDLWQLSRLHINAS